LTSRERKIFVEGRGSKQNVELGPGVPVSVWSRWPRKDIVFIVSKDWWLFCRKGTYRLGTDQRSFFARALRILGGEETDLAGRKGK